MTAPTRKDLLVLALVVLAGWFVQRWLAEERALGTDLRGDPTVAALLKDTASPRRDVAAPTLTLVVFTDYRCPACKRAAPAMDAAVARDGHVRVVYRDWPIFGGPSVHAARIAIAAARQGVYPALHSRLMAETRPLEDRILREAVERSGGDWAGLVRDVRERRPAIDAQLADTARAAVTLGIPGTPAYLIGPTLVMGGLDDADFTRAFTKARAADSK